MKKIFILAIILLSGTAAASAQEFLTINSRCPHSGYGQRFGSDYRRSLLRIPERGLVALQPQPVRGGILLLALDARREKGLRPDGLRRILLLQPQTFDLVRHPFLPGAEGSVRTTRTTLSFPKTRIITQSSASKRSGRSAFRRIWPTAIGSAAIWVCR